MRLDYVCGVVIIKLRMHIYIDESGIFNNPANKDNTASCVVALVIPSTRKVRLFREFKALTSNWVSSGEEVKGRKLDEDQIAQVVALLQRYDVVLEITAIDLGLHTQDEISEFKERQAEETVRFLKPDHHPNIIKELTDARHSFNKMSNQLFVQAFIMFMLIPRTLRNAITYYARRIPEEMKSFHWVVDAKEKSITEHERLWSLVIFPIMYTQSIKQPMFYVAGGDYSYFERFQETDEEGIRQIEEEEGYEKGELGATKLELILGKSFKFQDSKDNVGLQMADILANATQRALNRKLKKPGWEDIGTLMIAQKPNSLQTFRFNTTGSEKRAEIIRTPFYGVIKAYSSKAKSMWRSEEEEAFLVRKNRKRNSHRMRNKLRNSFA